MGYTIRHKVTSDMVGMKGCGHYLDVCVACTWWR